jgi:hypothetical protein
MYIAYHIIWPGNGALARLLVAYIGGLNFLSVVKVAHTKVTYIVGAPFHES